MAEYIDKDKVLKTIDDEMNGYYTEEVSITDLFDAINKIPIADVVPRSEVEKAKQEVEKADKEIERLTKILENYALQYGTVTDKQKVIEQAKQEVAGQVIEEFKNLVINYMTNKELLLTVFKNAIAHAETELKKKYIGE